jgi:uncharacterized lipoprotein
MFLKAIATVALLAAALLSGCGTSSPGSKQQTRTGVSDNGYPPPASPSDVTSPALGSSSEQAHSSQGKPKVPEVEPAEKHGEKPKS